MTHCVHGICRVEGRAPGQINQPITVSNILIKISEVCYLFNYLLLCKSYKFINLNGGQMFAMPNE